MRWVLLLIHVCLILSCGNNDVPSGKSPNTNSAIGKAMTESDVPAPNVLRESVTVTARFRHDTFAFTQGLAFWNGRLFESTGQYGQSELRLLDLATGRVLRRIKLDAQLFGEGMTVLGGKAYVLTWLNQQAQVYDATSFKLERTHTYSGEGWGLTNNKQELFMSNGTNVITVRDPETFSVLRSIAVTYLGKPLHRLNELEWINGELWANVWQTEEIVCIDPSSGAVVRVLDLSGLLPDAERPVQADVLNGIAYDSLTQSTYVTGKNWPWIYRIQVSASKK